MKNNLFTRKQHRTRITVLVDMDDRYHYTRRFTSILKVKQTKSLHIYYLQYIIIY